MSNVPWKCPCKYSFTRRKQGLSSDFLKVELPRRLRCPQVTRHERSVSYIGDFWGGFMAEMPHLQSPSTRYVREGSLPAFQAAVEVAGSSVLFRGKTTRTRDKAGYLHHGLVFPSQSDMSCAL